MVSFGSRLRERREKLGLKQNELGKLLGVTGSAIGNYENGISAPKADVLYQVFDVLKCDANYLFQDEIKELDTDDLSVPEIKMIKKYRFLDAYGKEAVDGVLDVEYKRCKDAAAPKIRAARETLPEVAEEIENIINLRFSELKASAGTGYQLDDDQTTTWKVLYNEYTRMADFCLEVDGQSMEPKIFDGDIILIRQQPAVDVGEIGLFTVDDTGYVKQQGEDRLISINPNYDDIFPNEYANVICRGKVIGVLDPDWIVEQ